jgi:Tol biopolymer transport system component
VSPDGRSLVFTEHGLVGAGALVRLSLSSGSVVPLVDQAVAGQVSPDGKWIAYQSGVSGPWEVYVQPFPGPGPRRQISTTGGSSPLWSRDGRQVYFSALDAMMVADVTSGPSFSSSVPRVLFSGRFRRALNANTAYSQSADGRRFLLVQQTRPDRAVTRIEIVVNFSGRLAGS